MKASYDDFKKFLKSINELYTLTLRFIEYYDNEVKHVNGKKIHELSEEFKNLVLSGLNPDGEYNENAYALFIKDFIGLQIEDPRLYISKLKLEGIPDIKVVIKKTKFIEFVYSLNKLSKFILDKVNELKMSNTSFMKQKVSDQNIEDLITDIIKTSYDLSVGINAFTTSVWGLRKITPHYIKKAYDNISEDMLKALGFSKLMSIKEYELYGFPDYFTRCRLYQKHVATGYGSHYFDYYISVNGVPVISESLKEIQTVNPIKPETLGGAICTLNEVIWRYTDLLSETVSKWYDGNIVLEKTYVGEAWKSLKEIEWHMPEYLNEYGGLYANFEELLKGYVGSSYGSPFKFLMYENGVITKYFQWVYRGSYDRSGFSEYKLSRYILLSELFDDLMPAIFLGVVDTTFYLNNEKGLLILVRTEHGG